MFKGWGGWAEETTAWGKGEVTILVNVYIFFFTYKRGQTYKPTKLI